MPRADFYQLKSNDPASRYPLLCRLLEKAVSGTQQVYVVCRDDAEASHLNDYIWAFKPDSFIAHECAHSESGVFSPVILGHPATPKPHQPTHTDICINLSSEPAPKEYDRIIELVAQEETLLNTAREHFRVYRQQGRTMQSHKV